MSYFYPTLVAGMGYTSHMAQYSKSKSKSHGTEAFV